MFLLIFESIGTSELILIGVVALIFLGPRKLPEYAKKIGKIMNEFKSTTNEFKATWEREVNFDEEAKAFRIDDDISPAPVARVTSITAEPRLDEPSAPSITEVDPSRFSHPTPPGDTVDEPAVPAITATATATDEDLNDKKNWL